MLRSVCVSILLVALTACATPVRLGPDSDPRVARELLSLAAADGPVRLEINGVVRASDSTLPQPRLAQRAARGVPNLTVRFSEAPGAPGSAMLLLLFDPPADVQLKQACATAPLPAAVPSAEPLRLVAVFCDGRTFIADATGSTSGTSAADVDRLVWRTVGTLFPDNYPATYGIRHFLGL